MNGWVPERAFCAPFRLVMLQSFGPGAMTSATYVHYKDSKEFLIRASREGVRVVSVRGHRTDTDGKRI
jgi:hypothetical protein